MLSASHWIKSPLTCQRWSHSLTCRRFGVCLEALGGHVVSPKEHSWWRPSVLTRSAAEVSAERTLFQHDRHHIKGCHSFDPKGSINGIHSPPLSSKYSSLSPHRTNVDADSELVTNAWNAQPDASAKTVNRLGFWPAGGRARRTR